MNSLLFCSFITFYAAHPSYGLRNTVPEVHNVPLKPGENPGEPLLLTPFLEQSKIEEARNLSAVPEEYFFGIKSFSGFFTVDKVNDSNLFFWFIPATNANYKDVPVLLWLQGGPGSPSTMAALIENGPFQMCDETSIELSDISWTSNHSVIYIDNPVGTGFSFTNRGWRSSEEEIGQDLYTALTQFFQLFPELQKNDFFVTGESYAGKYIPAVSYVIHERNRHNNKAKINLKGLSIGNGLTDIVNQLNYGDYFYQIGLADFNTKEKMKRFEERTKILIQEGKFEEASTLYDKIHIGSYTKYPTIFKNVTGFDYYHNYLQAEKIIDSKFSVFLQQSDIRRALHVGNVSYVTDDEVEKSLKIDSVKSVAPWLSALLSYYKVLIYNGQLDLVVPYPLTVNYLRTLNFSAAEEYKMARRYKWMVDSEFAGYVKEAGNLMEVMVRNAGHIVPLDQPKWALDLITRFVRNIPLY